MKKNELVVAGLGPGQREHMTLAVINALKSADCVVGYKGYMGFVDDLTRGKEVYSTGMRGEIDRIGKALEFAMGGRKTVVVSSGDSGVYGMAGLIFEMLTPEQEKTIQLTVLPGITAACSAAALSGAPLMQDYCSISLSDLLVDKGVIMKRVNAAAEGDFVTVLYNPKSKKRRELLRETLDRFREARDGDTPVSVVTNAYREGQEVLLCRLSLMDDYFESVNMFSTIIIGNSRSRIKGDRLLTPRGYHV